MWNYGVSGRATNQPSCSFTADFCPYINYWMQGVELIIRVEKVILKRRGIIASDYCRSPSYDLDEREQLQIEQFMIEFAEWLK